MDAAGKDGTIQHIFSGVNPQGCDVTSFKVPTPLETRHDFLWRVHVAVPPRGMIGIFNRSTTKMSLSPRVHGLISAKRCASASMTSTSSRAASPTRRRHPQILPAHLP